MKSVFRFSLLLASIIAIFSGALLCGAPVFAASTTLPPAQNVVGPCGVMVAAGRGFIVTTVALAVVLEQPVTVFVTITL